MKKVLLFALILVIVSCVQTTEKKAQKAVALYLKENLDDWKSYEPIEFGYPDSSMSTFDQAYMLMLSDSVNSMKIFNSQMELFNFYLEDHNTIEAKKIILYCDSVSKVSKITDSLLNERRKDWQPSFDGWNIKHKYRAKNKQGNYEVFERWFHVYREFSGAVPIYE